MPAAPETAAYPSRPLAAALSILLTGIAVLYIVLRVDWPRLALRDLQIHWISLGAGIVVIVGFCLVSALRWAVLFGGRLDIRAASRVVFIGLGLNAILPARGGDIVRLLYLRNVMDIALPASVLRLAVEKSLDLVCVVLVTMVSGSVLFGNLWPGRALPLAAAAVLLLLLVLAARHPAVPGALLERLCTVARLPEAMIVRQQELLHEFSGLFQSRLLVPAAALSLLNWFVLQYVFVTLVTRSMGVGLDYPSALLVVSFAALGFSLPAAPAGIGVYHAAVTAALELLGHPAERGLVIATVLHLANTLPLVVLAGASYATGRRRQDPGGQPGQ